MLLSDWPTGGLPPQLSSYRARELKRRYEEDDRQELEQRLAAPKAELAKTLKKADAATRLFWSQDLRHLTELIHAKMFEADHGVTYPSTTEPQTGTYGGAEYEEFVRETLPRGGWSLSASGQHRLLLFCIAQAYSANKADMADPNTWAIAFRRMYDLGIFDESKAEIGYDESLREPDPPEPPAPQLGMSDLEGIDTSTKVGQRIAHTILSREVFDGEAKEVFRGFVTHVKNTFHYDLTPDDQREIILYFTQHNKNFLDHRAYDLAKVSLIRRGLLPPSLFTEDELLAESIESTDDRNYESRRRLKQKIVAARRQQ